MRPVAALYACLLLCSATVARADTQTFVVANQPDGYGVDQCLANGDPCGVYAARAYCQSRDYAQASAYHRVIPSPTGETTGAVAVSTGQSSGHAGSGDYVAITCQR